MKKKFITTTQQRIVNDIVPQDPLRYLKEHDIVDYVDTIISTLYLYTRPKKGRGNESLYLTELISAIGHAVRGKLRLKKDSSIAAKTGAFFLYSFELMGITELALGRGTNGHNAYVVKILNDDIICKAWAVLPKNVIEKLPREQPYAPWTSFIHETGKPLIKTKSQEVRSKVKPETHPIVFSCVNKAQEVGWNINREVYKLHSWALLNKTDAFADIWEQHNPEAKATKLREVQAIGSIAKKMLDTTFYHLYSYDFRGRKYPSTAYLHEQGTDLARGMLLQSNKKPIGKLGYFWLLVSIASTWGGDAGREDGAKTDKIPMKDRFYWVTANEEIILSYAEAPKTNQGWMQADKPWQFIAACFELRKLREWQYFFGTGFDDYNYASGLEVYIDGSNNGSQHLSALTKDEITAPHVNLVPAVMPGDLYKYVATHVWSYIDSIVAAMDQKVVEDCERFIDESMELKRRITMSTSKSAERAGLVDQIKQFRADNVEISALAAPVYWHRVKSDKQRRKICKRNIMTLPYGGTPYGLGQQHIDDAKKHGIDLLMHMEHKWGAYLGRIIFEDCRVSLARPMQLLSVFEAAGKRAENEGEYLSWTVPITNFPVVQYYVEGKVKKIWVQYGPKSDTVTTTKHDVNALQLAICFVEDTVQSKGKQSQGASPNAIHSLDAAHLMLVVDRADFAVTTIHDSYGCLLADMSALFKIVREEFVHLYSADPIYQLMSDIKGDLSDVKFGKLDLSQVLDSEYCFS